MARVSTHPSFHRTVKVDTCCPGIIKKSTPKSVLGWKINYMITPHVGNNLESLRKGHPTGTATFSILPASVPQCICIWDDFIKARKCINKWSCSGIGQMVLDKPDMPQPMLLQGCSLALETENSQIRKFTKENTLHRIQITILLKLISKHFSQKSHISARPDLELKVPSVPCPYLSPNCFLLLECLSTSRHLCTSREHTSVLMLKSPPFCGFS